MCTVCSPLPRPSPSPAQALTLLNVPLNFLLLDLFLGGRFLLLGPRWLATLALPASSLLADTFPKMTACSWRQHGEGGDMETLTYLCLLGTNRVTEKVLEWSGVTLKILYRYRYRYCVDTYCIIL